MKLSVLKALIPLFNSYQSIFELRRIQDNLLRLSLDFDHFYIDVSKSKSLIFMSEEKISGNPYHAPFDVAIQKFCSRAKLVSSRLDGENRILIFEFLHSRAYKQERCYLIFELTGRHTNVILLDEHKRIIEAMRHISSDQSTRVIRPNKPYPPLPQPLHTQEIEEIADLRAYLKEEYARFVEQKIQQKKRSILNRRLKKLRPLERILHSLPNLEDLEEQSRLYASYGELIFASLHQLAFFQNKIELVDAQNRKVEIVFSEKIRSYAQGGNDFYQQSKKCKQRLENLWIQQENLQSKILFLQNEIAYIQSIRDYQELQIFSPPSQMKLKKQAKKDYESFFIDGIKVSMGRNAKENQKLLSDAKADDLWLHIQNIPSSHMVIHCGKAKCKDEVLYRSAKILLGIHGLVDRNVSIDYTQRRFVRVVQGANVVYSKQKTLRF